jgi:hypothetical protein
MDAQELQRLKELAQAATPGPWRYDGLEVGDRGNRYPVVIEQADGDYVLGEYGMQEFDAALIAHIDAKIAAARQPAK